MIKFQLNSTLEGIANCKSMWDRVNELFGIIIMANQFNGLLTYDRNTRSKRIGTLNIVNIDKFISTCYNFQSKECIES